MDVRRASLGGLLALVVVSTSACGSSNQATVPSRVRAALVRDFPGWAFVPSRLPSGYHYATWIGCRNGSCYSMEFLRGSRKITGAVGLGSTGLKKGDSLNLQVKRGSCPAPPKWRAKDTHTVRVNGHTLKWLQTESVGPFVWRCLTNQGRRFVIFSAGGPTQKLVELVGYAVPAH